MNGLYDVQNIQREAQESFYSGHGETVLYNSTIKINPI